METGKTGKYLKYAIGEIVLVVIGILIALQINNWNTQRLNNIKEKRILLEIKDNLNEDLQNIERILTENKIKIEAVDSAFYYMSKMYKNKSGRVFSNLMPILTNYDLFHPTSVAFDNMIASGNIDILLSDELRKDISRYYTSDQLDGIQDQLIVTTQSFLNGMAHKLINKEMLKAVFNLDFEIRTVDDITVHRDPYVISDLYVMKNKTRLHNRILNKMNTQINGLLESIDKYINVK